MRRGFYRLYHRRRNLNGRASTRTIQEVPDGDTRGPEQVKRRCGRVIVSREALFHALRESRSQNIISVLRARTRVQHPLPTREGARDSPENKNEPQHSSVGRRQTLEE